MYNTSWNINKIVSNITRFLIEDKKFLAYIFKYYQPSNDIRDIRNDCDINANNDEDKSLILSSAYIANDNNNFL